MYSKFSILFILTHNIYQNQLYVFRAEDEGNIKHQTGLSHTIPCLKPELHLYYGLRLSPFD